MILSHVRSDVLGSPPGLIAANIQTFERPLVVGVACTTLLMLNACPDLLEHTGTERAIEQARLRRGTMLELFMCAQSRLVDKGVPTEPHVAHI